jgi:hypothetical protein
MNPPLETCKSVCDNAQYVKINFSAMEQFCTRFTVEHMKHWFDEAPFDIQTLSPQEKLHFLFLFNAISFCYWGSPKWTIEYHGQQID